ncbi:MULTISPECIES: DsrE family protein [unclassified Spirosoma]|uniref:DsrE family protein n=1 Tax=unclassified Spirosoma TaxID=2621999 RepID=UPI000A9D8D6F|nr:MULTISPECIES: DsrE family protein [unclassified Spirosoma]
MMDRAPDTGKGHRVVFQFVSPDDASQKALISNLKNLLAIWPEAEVEVVVHGPGIDLITASETRYAQPLQQFVDHHVVRIVVCENSLRSKQLTLDDMLPSVETVPVAIIELILKQEQGWAYIKAGV